MAWTTYRILMSVLMVLTGSVNTLAGKWANRMESTGRDGRIKKFTHPFFQVCCFFLGELCCLFTFKLLYKIYSLKCDGTENTRNLTKGNRNFNPFYMLVPAFCEIIGTPLMYIGLNITYASIVQRLRATVIIFVCILSVIFLKTVPRNRELYGILFVAIGLTIGGLPDFLSKETNKESRKTNVMTGYILMFGAELMTAAHLVFEEKFVKKQDVPSLLAVGWEGLFGFTLSTLLLLPCYFIYANPPITHEPGDRLEDTVEAFVQIWNNRNVALAVSVSVISSAFFNFAGITVTKELSATARMVVDSVRTIFVCIGSIAFFEQKFNWLQPVAIVLVLIGMCLYNGCIFPLSCNGVLCRQMDDVYPITSRATAGSIH